MANAQLIAENVMRAQADREASTNRVMEATVYNEKLVKVLTLIGVAEVAIEDYTPNDVELHDVTSGEYRRQLDSAKEKYNQATEEICGYSRN